MDFVKVQKYSPEVFYKKGIIKKFAKFIGKHLYQSFFLKVRARALEVKLIHTTGTYQIKKQSSGGVLLKRCS